MTRGLLDMPNIVMSEIMEDVGIKGILTLRKVCHDLRTFIDDVKPDAKLEKIWINWQSSDCIYSDFYFMEGIYEVEYKKRMEGCLVENYHKGNGVLLKNNDFIATSMKDLELVLGHQKSVLKQFVLTGRNEGNMDVIILENIQRILKSRIQKLKVEKFTAEYMNQNQLMYILPFLDSKTLNTLEIRNQDHILLEVDKLVKLDQWRNIKHLLLDATCVIDLDYIQHFTHFTTNYIQFKTTHIPDLVLLKDMFLQSTGFQYIWIYITDKHDLYDVHRSTESLGPPYLDTHHRIKWFYRIPTTNQILDIEVINQDSRSIDIRIKLSRIEECMVPEEAVIQN